MSYQTKMAVLRTATKILTNFPLAEIKYAFCYGSAAFQQVGSDMSTNVLDFIFVTDDKKKFHTENLKRNKKHYSFLRHFGVNAVCYVQGTGVYFNTLVLCEGRIIKYGVVSTIDFKSDLLDWTTLYLSGRLHKPVLEVHNTDNTSNGIQAALKNNLESALHCGLLLLPETFTEQQLYTQLASLSYSGDFRMRFGEDKNKVSNIVNPNIEKFRDLYKDIIEQEDHLVWSKRDGTFDQLLDFRSRFHHLNRLPCRVQERLTAYRNKDGRSRDAEEVMRTLASDANSSKMIRQAISDIVRRSSWEQTVKSAFSAGLLKSLRYSKAKVSKMLKSTRQTNK